MSITKVAEAAGVSKSTVSRVINCAPGVTDSVRESVLAAMEELDYRPSARRPGPKPASRKGIRTGNIMLLILGVESHQVYRMPVFPALLQGIESALRAAGLNLVMASYHAQGPLPAGLGADQVDGVLVLGRAEIESPSLRSKLDNIATVGLLRGRETFDGVTDQVLYNNRMVGPMMARYLLGRGHRHLAFINAQSSHYAFAARMEGFVQTAREAGADVIELVADDGGVAQLSTMRDFVKALLRSKSAITGIAACSDLFLSPLAQALAEAGHAHGQGIDLIGCDNEDQFLRQLSPRPASIDIHPQLIGQHAVRQLIWRMGNMNEGSQLSLIVEPKLIAGM